MRTPGYLDETAVAAMSMRTITAQCPSRLLLEELSDKWTLLVIGVLDERPLRFNALRRAVDGVSQKMLAQTLRRLERLGMVQRTVAVTGPVAVEYSLTELGRSLREPVTALWRWTEEHADQIPHELA